MKQLVPNPIALVLGLAVSAVCPAALAYDQGDWAVHVGVHQVDPKSDNHEIVGVESATGLTANLLYFFTPTIATDLLVALPFKHDITLNGDGSEVGSTRHLPPTLSLVWYPQLSPTWHPFVGAGINYTLFFEEHTRGALDGTRLKLDDSVGPALQAGLAYTLSPHWSLTVDARYMQIRTDAHLNGDSLGEVEIDPFTYGAGIEYRF